MSFAVATALKSVCVFVGMLALFEAGRRIGLARTARDPESLSKGAGPIEAAIFGLLGLLLAFTFSGAALRFEDRRHLITQEANAIGTAYLRLDLLPADVQPELRQLFRQYVDARIDVFRDYADTIAAGASEKSVATDADQREVARLQGKIWSASVAATQRAGMPESAALLMLPALNDMIDITTTRAMATQNHPPGVVFQLLIAFSLIGALLAGYSMAANESRNWFYMLLVSVTLSLTLYVIFDLEYPRFGLIRIDAADQLLVEVRKSLQ